MINFSPKNVGPKLYCYLCIFLYIFLWLPNISLRKLIQDSTSQLFISIILIRFNSFLSPIFVRFLPSISRHGPIDIRHVTISERNMGIVLFTEQPSAYGKNIWNQVLTFMCDNRLPSLLETTSSCLRKDKQKFRGEQIYKTIITVLIERNEQRRKLS